MITLAADPLNHVLNYWPTGHPEALTMHVATLLIAALLTIVVMVVAAGRIETGPASEGNRRYLTRGRFAQMIEVMVLYLRDEMLQPVLGDRDTRRYAPYLLTLFFFILFNNLLGLLPLLDVQHLLGSHSTWVGGTATGNINITGGLATIAFVVIIMHSIRELGVGGFLAHMTGGLHKEHWALWTVIPIIFIVEVAGLFIKPAALAIRLFANMLAGHTLLAVLLGFGLAGAKTFSVGMLGITLVGGLAATAIMFLELFVAFLQAFIFMFLTAVFISLMSHHDEHEHEHEESHAVEAVHAH